MFIDDPITRGKNWPGHALARYKPEVGRAARPLPDRFLAIRVIMGVGCGYHGTQLNIVYILS